MKKMEFGSRENHIPHSVDQKNSDLCNFESREETVIIILDNYTRQLAGIYKNLLFGNYPVFYFLETERVMDEIRKHKWVVLVSQLLLFDADFISFQRQLQSAKFKGEIILFNTDILAERAVRLLKHQPNFTGRIVNHLEKIEYMIKLLYQDSVNLPLEMSPFTEREEICKIKVPSDFCYIDRIVQFVLKKLYSVVHTHSYDNSIRMVLIEALTNAMEHGNKFDITKYVYVNCSINQKRFFAVIRDEGAGFDLQCRKDIKQVNRQYGNRGRGLIIIKNFMDKVWHNKEGNTIYFQKNFQPEN